MNKPDCGNHSTGQPKCVQLMANTLNRSLIFFVAPQVAHLDAGLSRHAVPGLANGFSNVLPGAFRSAGNRLTGPSVDPDFVFAALRRTAAARYPTPGMATIAAAQHAPQRGQQLEKRCGAASAARVCFGRHEFGVTVVTDIGRDGFHCRAWFGLCFDRQCANSATRSPTCRRVSGLKSCSRPVVSAKLGMPASRSGR